MMVIDRLRKGKGKESWIESWSIKIKVEGRIEKVKKERKKKKEIIIVEIRKKKRNMIEDKIVIIGKRKKVKGIW